MMELRKKILFIENQILGASHPLCELALNPTTYLKTFENSTSPSTPSPEVSSMEENQVLPEKINLLGF